MKFRKGDIVGRLSYNKDIVFTVSNIIKCRNQDIAILKGLVTRIEADSPLDDLELIDNNRVINLLDSFEKELEKSKKSLVNVQNNMFKRYYQHYGRILHLDGDRKYSEKSQKVYKSMGLNVIVKNIPESKQPQMIWGVLGKYNPDILVITGHDGMIKKGYNFNDIYNYRNSKYFVETVIRARMWEQGANKLAIFAGACQSYYVSIIGYKFYNYFVDKKLNNEIQSFAPNISEVYLSDNSEEVDANSKNVNEALDNVVNYKNKVINDIKNELRDGENGVSGIGAQGKKRNI